MKHKLYILINGFLLFLLIQRTQAQTNDPYYAVQYDEAGKPLLLKHQLIIAFKPELLKKSVIDNKEIVTGQLQDFFSEEGIYLAQQLGIWNDDIASAPTRKIYEYLSTKDSVSITRTGETINIPKYWATLLVFWPLTESKPITQVCDSLRKFYPYIEFAHPNYLYKQNSVPNDPYYVTDQFNLHPSGNQQEGNIDIENAWDIESGSPDIKLGVFDSPIVYTHEDFGGGSLATSKIKGGKVYYQAFGIKDISLFPITTTIDNHGTCVAGVAAAIRNNEKGIAGVAGGNFSLNGNTGVSLYTFGLFGDAKQTNTPNGYCTDAMAATAISEGANYILQPNGTYSGYGLHVENHSWGGPSLSDNIRRAIKGAARNKCVVVCSRGNDGDGPGVPKEGTDTDNYPAVYNDEWVISVGASGMNKARLSIAGRNTGVISNTGLSLWSSSYGKKMDVLAPAAQELMITTTADNIVIPIFTLCQYSGYCYFVGTSAAAPHVSGLAALIHSKYRYKNGFTTILEPEDVENLIEQNTFHTGPTPNSYTDTAGWGMISPDNSLAQIKDNRYKIYHFTNGGAVSYINQGNITLTIPTGAFGLPSGTYTAEKWQVTYTQSNTFAPSEQILGYWPRLNASEGSNSFNGVPVSEDDWANFTFTMSGTNTLNVSAYSYAYYIPSRNQWLYKDKVDIKTAYSVHTFNSLANAVNEVSMQTASLKAYPNPAQNKVTIELAENTLQALAIYDMKGNQVPVEYSILSKNIVLNTTNLAEGLYVCKTYLNNNSIVLNKIIISK